MFTYSPFVKFQKNLRDFMSREMFIVIKKYCVGNVLDVGGASFVISLLKRGVEFNSWVSLDQYEKTNIIPKTEKIKFEVGDGNKLRFQDCEFDTVLNIQVLEHTFTPIQMFNEGARVLKSGGYYLLLIPQNAAIHMAPSHFQNFTRYWILEAAKRAELEIVLLKPLGGWWKTMASRQYSFFLTALKREGNFEPEYKRNIIFYILFPLMVGAAILTVPFFLLLSLGDLLEEPPNHLVVLRKS